MVDNGTESQSDPEEEERRVLDAFREDFLRSQEAGNLVADADAVTRILNEQAARRGKKIDRSAVWERLVSEAVTADRAEGGDLAAEFDAAAARARTGVIVRDIPVGESLEAAETALKTEFPFTPFRVLSKADVWGVWLLATWTDGPPETIVSQVANRFKGVQETAEGPVRWAFYGVSLLRRHTPKSRSWAEAQWNAAGVHRRPDDAEHVTGIDEDAEEISVAGVTVPANPGYPMERHVNDLLALVDLTTDPPTPA